MFFLLLTSTILLIAMFTIAVIRNSIEANRNRSLRKFDIPVSVGIWLESPVIIKIRRKIVAMIGIMK